MNRISHIYIDGFRSMRVGRKLWLIIFIKLFIIFAVLKIFFYPNFLETHFPDEQARAEHVLENLTDHSR